MSRLISGKVLERCWLALRTGYNIASLRQMLRLRLDRTLDDIVAVGAIKDTAFELLETAEREGWSIDLMREAYRFNPGQPELMSAFDALGLAILARVQANGADAGPPETKVTSSGFEAILKARVAMLDLGVWRTRLSEIEARVCRVEIEGRAAGTGFLVGPNAVLTNYHVLKPIIVNPKRAKDVACRFDYELLADGTRLPGVAVKLHPKDWRADDSPYTEDEEALKPDRSVPDEEHLDYALIVLERNFGAESATPAKNGPQRGWISLPEAPPKLEPGDALTIVQHPDGAPLKLALDTEAVIGFNAKRTRLRYATNTEPGSSGSPCFALDWTLVALHHYGDPALNHPRFNQGVPIDKIRGRIERGGMAKLVPLAD
jgi:hypothetical protein